MASRIRVSKSEYEEMLARQGGVCAICNKRQVSRRLAVDHDHETGQIRGLLCLRCNQALGRFEWSDTVLSNLISYVLRFQQARRQWRFTNPEIGDP